MLNFLVDKQKQLVARGTFDNFIGKEGEDVYEAFWRSPLYDETIVEAEKEIFRAKGEEKYLIGLKGMVFAKMSFGYMSAEENEKGNLVLPEEGSLAIANILHPEAEVVDNAFGLRGLRGVSLTDGFIVNNKGLVSGGIEYTLSKIPNKLAYQYKGFQSLSQKMDGLLAKKGAEFVYVTPRENDGEIVHARDEKYRDVRFEPLPVMREEFEDFIYDVYRDHIKASAEVSKIKGY